MKCGACCGYPDLPCEHLDMETKRCKVWRTDRQPIECRLHPTHPMFISQHIECGFRFYDAETGAEVTKKKRRNAEGNWECDWDELKSYPLLDEEC